MSKFHFFLTTADIEMLREVKDRRAQIIYNDMLKHYQRSREQGVHLLHAEDYFDMPLEAILAALHMNPADIDWKLIETARIQFKITLQQRHAVNGEIH